MFNPYNKGTMNKIELGNLIFHPIDSDGDIAIDDKSYHFVLNRDADTVIELLKNIGVELE